MSKRLFTSESVTQGHPDKMCDQISDSILDEILKNDRDARVACETLATTGLVFVTGEITTNCYVDIESIVRKTVNEIGYNRAKYGFDSETCSVITSLKGQSPDIAQGVDKSLEARFNNEENKYSIGAGDQGMMFGFACDETVEYMPLPIFLAHKLTKRLDEVRKTSILPYLRPDGKSQVTIEYDGSEPVRVDTVVISSQHSPKVDQSKLTQDIIEEVIKKVIPSNLLDINTKYFINPTGRFVVGGPQGDCGLTGRKIIVDTYGGYASHGGGAFSGKDATKVDRSGAYAARYIAKNLVAANVAKKCEIEIAYAIGVSKPVSVYVNTFGTSKTNDEKINKVITELFDLRPAAIIERLDLKKPIFKNVAAYGHFGRNDLNLTWEKLDMVDAIQSKLL